MIARALLVATTLVLAACQLPGIVGAIGHNIEREKKIEVLAKYTGLDNKRVAVMVKADMGVLYEHPTLMPNVSANLSQRLHENVSGIKVLDPRTVLNFQYQRPSWAAMPLGQVAEELDVDRIVVVDKARIVEVGSHVELLARGEKYAALARAWEKSHAL